MSIESNIFKRYTPDWDKCQKEYEKIFLNGSFKALLRVNEQGEVMGTVYDLENNDEFLPLRIESREGSFAGKVREENVFEQVDEVIHKNTLYKR